MASPKLSTVIEGIKTVLKTVKSNSTYPNKVDIANDNIHTGFTDAFKVSQEYPRIAIVFSGKDNKQKPGAVVGSRADFTLIFITAKLDDNDEEPDIKLSNAVEDIEQAFAQNDSLGGVVQDAFVVNVIVEQTATYPEGIAIFTLMVEYDQQY